MNTDKLPTLLGLIALGAIALTAGLTEIVKVIA